MLFAIALFAAVISAPQPQVLFAVIRGDEPAIEPVAMVTKTPGPCTGCWRLRFDDVLQSDDDDAFTERYYRHGRTYRVLTGGFDAGTATVDKETSLGCVSLAAAVTITPPLPQNWPALAVGSLHVPPRTSDRLEPTPEEQHAIAELARREFRKRHISAALIAKMEAGSDISIDLDHDGNRDLIESFAAIDNTNGMNEHHLFLIAMGDGRGNYRTVYVWYAGLVQGMGENQIQNMQLIDTLDLDEDGVDELVTSTIGYEGNQYQILKRGRNGKWTIVYNGGGSGC